MGYLSQTRVIYIRVKLMVLFRVTRRLEKNSQNFSKNGPKIHQVKKGQNICYKAQFENPKHLHQTTLKTLKYLQQTM
jgi:hypothetical protein